MARQSAPRCQLRAAATERWVGCGWMRRRVPVCLQGAVHGHIAFSASAASVAATALATHSTSARSAYVARSHGAELLAGLYRFVYFERLPKSRLRLYILLYQRDGLGGRPRTHSRRGDVLERFLLLADRKFRCIGKWRR